MVRIVPFPLFTQREKEIFVSVGHRMNVRTKLTRPQRLCWLPYPPPNPYPMPFPRNFPHPPSRMISLIRTRPLNALPMIVISGLWMAKPTGFIGEMFTVTPMFLTAERDSTDVSSIISDMHMTWERLIFSELRTIPT